MKNTTTITLSRIINVSRERAWQAWTDPKEVMQWWGPDGVTIPVCEMDVRTGGALHIVMLAGKELGSLAGQRWPMRGIFQEIKKPEKIVFTNQAVDENDNVLIDGLTTVIFEQEGSKTKVTVTTSATGVAPQSSQMIAGMEIGWNQQLDKFSKILGKVS